jgi:hypothetical protein
MTGPMDEGYFDEKRGLAQEAIECALKEASDALALIRSTRHFAPDMVESEQVHELLKMAALRLKSARRDFEKSRWASARTNVEFDDWLNNGPGHDLR